MPTPTQKFEILKNDRNTAFNRPVYRIRALRDIPTQRVRAGDLGGFVENERNLAQEGDAWIANSASAVDRSRVEGNALVKDHSIIADYAVIKDSAVVGSFATIKGHAVVRDNARVMGSSMIEDEVAIQGNLNIRQTTFLSGDGEYRYQSQIPWSLHFADPKEPEYLDRVIEAANIDPAFHRVFAAMDIHDAPGRTDAIRELFNDEKGSKALFDIVRTIGGTFTPEAYQPRSTAQILEDRSTLLQVALYSPEFTDYRILNSVRGDEGYEQETGDTLYPAVVMVNIVDPQTKEPQTLFQPAHYKETVPDHPTLTPLIGSPMIANEVYTNHTDAANRAEDLLKAAITPAERRVMPEARAIQYGDRLAIDVRHLPMIVDSKIVLDQHGRRPLQNYENRVTVQNVSLVESLLSNDLGGLSQPAEYAVFEIPSEPKAPVSFKDIDKKAIFYTNPIMASQDATPIFTDNKNFLNRIRDEIFANDKRLEYLTDYFAKNPDDEKSTLPPEERENLRIEFDKLNPVHSPVLMMVMEKPDLSKQPSAAALDWHDSFTADGGQHAYSEIGGQAVAFRIQPSDPDLGLWMLNVEQRSGSEDHYGYGSVDEAKRVAETINSTIAARNEATVGAFALDNLKNALAPMEWRNCPNPDKSAIGSEKWLDNAYEAISLHTRFTIEQSDGKWSVYVDSPNGDPFVQEPFHRAENIGTMDEAMEVADNYRITMITDQLAPQRPSPAPILAAGPDVNENHFAAVSRFRTSDGMKFKPTTLERQDVGYAISYSNQVCDTKEEAANQAAQMLADRHERHEASVRPRPAIPAPSSSLGF